MLAKIFSVILFSLSVRTANIQPNPADYEVMVGFDGVYGTTKIKYEQEKECLDYPT